MRHGGALNRASLGAALIKVPPRSTHEACVKLPLLFKTHSESKVPCSLGQDHPHPWKKNWEEHTVFSACHPLTWIWNVWWKNSVLVTSETSLFPFAGNDFDLCIAHPPNHFISYTGRERLFFSSYFRVFKKNNLSPPQEGPTIMGQQESRVCDFKDHFLK